jgi:3-oxoadipate enol-lactonase / 4-carboxymuconolactone decarboxylase
MALLTRDGRSTYYRCEGRDDRPTIVLSHSLGLDHGMWDALTADLLPYFRVLRYDLPGHGGSSAPEGEYTIAGLAGDVLALADACGVGRFAFCGLSIGGMIGQWLGANAAQRLTHLVLANTTARLSNPESMEERRQIVLTKGMRGVEDIAMGRYFSKETLSKNSPAVGSARRTLLSSNPIGYAGCCAAIRDMDQTAILSHIHLPTLVIVGDQDVGMPWDGHGEVLTRSIAGARAVRLPAAHISNIERPRSFSAAVLDFLVPRSADVREAGLAVRRAVLGNDHVDRALASTTDFTRAFQDLIATYPWGSIWTRPGLDHHTRRLLVLAVTAALGRLEEFRLHVRTGLAHELEPCDIEEVLLQTAVYAGVPAGNTAFHIAAEEIEKSGR